MHIANHWVVRLSAGGLLLAGAAFGVWAMLRQRPTLEQASEALANGDYATAADVAATLLDSAPDNVQALLIAAEAEAYRDEFARALELLAKVRTTDAPMLGKKHAIAGNVLASIGEARQAEARFREAISADPEQWLARERLALLLEWQGRHFEATPHHLALARAELAMPAHLLMMAPVGTPAGRAAEVDRFRRARPRDNTLLLAQGVVAADAGDLAQARKLLEESTFHVPRAIEAHARLGALLCELETPDEAACDQWLAGLNNLADEHPAVWHWRGEIAARRDQMREAARCLWESARRDPNQRVALYRLSQMLSELGDVERARPFAERAGLLRDYDETCRLLIERQRDVALLLKAAAQCESLGRAAEALCWYQAVRKIDADHAVAAERSAALRSRAAADASQTLAEFNPALQVDLSSFPLPERTQSKPLAVDQPPSETSEDPISAGANVTFDDVAAAAGVEFSYFNAADPRTPGARMFEFTGGGIGVIDFDRDGWPDLYLTQGCQWPPTEQDRDRTDALFRNEGDGRFTSIGDAAGILDQRFGQGTAVGDVDADGFPDVYVANIGANRLYRNNGDGTFSDATAASGIAQDAWTTSCLVADLNADGLPDLYDVTYAQGADVFDRICGYRGQPGICPPTVFEAQHDRLWLNQGDGRFENCSAAAGIERPAGYGLGIVAADFSLSGKTNLFVANDQTANFYFVNETEAAGGAPRFSERGMTMGLALDRNAMAQACMGVAAGDADSDGRLDLYVTNYYEESNALYRQKGSGVFVDESRGAGLAAPSIPMLGFGAQFLDADLDGREDLLVANGHIFKQADGNVPYAMRAQCMYNLGGGKFRELDPQSLGGFFVDLHLGRAMARWDWNRDGRDEVCIGRLEAPTALLVNRTTSNHHFISLALTGVKSNRDAIGAVAAIVAGGRSLVRHVSAGDGYQASNERRLTFGLGSAAAVQEVRVRWPGGQEQTWRDLPADREWLLIEGRAEAIALIR